MYFYTKTPVEPAYRIKFDSYRKLFDPHDWIYNEHLSSFNDVIMDAASRKRAADFSAAVFTALFHSGMLLKGFLPRIIDFSRDAILDMGFTESDSEDIQNDLTSPEHGPIQNVIFVAGCQNHVMLGRRLDKAVEFIHAINSPWEIIFSGRNSARSAAEKVGIPNESIRMRNLFRRKLRVKNARTGISKGGALTGEGNSFNTETNIKELFDPKNKYIPEKREYNLIIISSSFHLINLGKKVVDAIKDLPQGSRAPQRLALIGAEDAPEESEIGYRLEDAPFFKLAMVEVYFRLYTEQAEFINNYTPELAKSGCRMPSSNSPMPGDSARLPSRPTKEPVLTQSSNRIGGAHSLQKGDVRNE